MLQSLLVVLLPARIAVLPALLFLSTRLVDTLLIWSGMRANPHMAGVVHGKTAAQFPGSTAPSQHPVVVIKLAARSNHPLGLLHPHMRAISAFFVRMVGDLDARSEQYDFLGASSFLANERATANEVMILAYFRTYEGLHAWAHEAGGVHREAWTYWNTKIMAKGNADAGRMFSIMHELYQVPAAQWEAIYINHHPSGLGATTYKVDVDGRAKWASPLVDARKGLLRTSKGRMAMSAGNENEVYGDDPFDNEKA